VIVQKVRDAERERQYDEYKDRIGEIVHGTVKRVEFGSVVVDFGRAEGVVRRDEMIPRESFRNGDRIRAYIYDVRRETRGPQIFLSARIRNSWPGCSRRKCRKSMTASSRFARSRAIREAAPRSR
jgi:ribosomal protein S1